MAKTFTHAELLDLLRTRALMAASQAAFATELGVSPATLSLALGGARLGPQLLAALGYQKVTLYIKEGQ